MKQNKPKHIYTLFIFCICSWRIFRTFFPSSSVFSLPAVLPGKNVRKMRAKPKKTAFCLATEYLYEVAGSYCPPPVYSSTWDLGRIRVKFCSLSYNQIHYNTSFKTLILSISTYECFDYRLSVHLKTIY